MAFKKNTARGVEIPSSSFADIAFLLLVFFLVCTVIDMDKGLKMVLPAIADTIPVPPDNLLNILINDDNEILAENNLLSLQEIKGFVREKMLENSKLIVSLKPSRKAKYNVYINILDQLKSIGMTRISIADPES